MERRSCVRFLSPILLFFTLLFLWPFVMISEAQALVYLQGQVTYNGKAYTSSASVSLSCNASNYKYASAWGSINSSGEYTFDSTKDSWNPCSSTNKDVKWDCKAYASQWNDTKIANSKEVAVALDCSKTLRQDYDLTPKDKTIKVTIQDSSKKAITTGMTVSCSQSVSPWGYGSANSSTDGAYPVPVTAGTYTCSAYCDWNTWKGNCPYSGNPQVSVTVAETDTTVTPTALTFTTKDKTIRVSVKAGTTTVKSGISVNCSQNVSPWSYGSSNTATSDGKYELKVTSGSFNCSASCSTWPCTYSGNPTKLVSVADSDTIVDAALKYTVKDKTLYVKVLAGETAVSSGVSVYCNQQGGSWDYASATTAQSDGRYKLALGEGIYTCSAYCTNYQSCDVSGYPRAKVEFVEADTTAEASLNFLKKDSTISGVVTDGKSGISNVYVSVNSYQVKGKTGTGTAALVAKEIAWTGKLATVTSEDTSTQVYGGANTSSSGSFEVRIPAGTYKVSVYAPPGTEFGPADVEATATSKATTVVNLVLPKKGGKIKGCVTDASGNPVTKYWVNASSYNGSSYVGDWASTQGDNSGCYSLNVLEKRVYTVNVNINTWGDATTKLCSNSNEGNQSVTTSGTVTVNFTIPNCDCQMTVNAVDGGGNLVTTVSGSLDARPTSSKSNEYFYGVWGQLTGGTGTLKVVAGKEYKFKGWIWDSKYSGDAESIGTCKDGAGKVDLILAKKIKEAVTGTYVDGDGNALDLSKASYLSVNATKGSTYSYCNVDLKKYSCDLTPGTWHIGYWIDPGSGFASSSIGTSSNSVTVTASGGIKKDLTLLVTGSIDMTVLNIDGSGRPNSSVTCNPFSSEGKNDYQYLYSSGWCQTDGNGKCKMNVGAASGKGTDYYCMANLPYGMKLNEGLNNPKETKVTVLPAKTVEAKLSYQKADGKVTITVKEGNLARSALTLGTAMRGDEEDLPALRTVINATKDATDASSPVANATVDCFSSKGGSYEVKADALGVATCLCATNDTWYAVAHNLVGNALYISKSTKVPCSVEGASGSATIDFVTTVPEGATKTVTDAATQALNIALTDGFSVLFPAGSLLADKDAQATAKVEVSLTPITSTQIPVSYYAYNVSAVDSKNVAIVQLKSDATFSVPYKQTQVDKMGLTEKEIRPCYFNTSEGSYTTITTAAMDKEKKTISYTQSHLTDYAVIGNGYLGALQGEDKGAVGVAKGEDGTATGAGANGGDTGTGSSGGGDSSGSGAASGCSGGCYTVATEPSFDDMIPWLFAILTLGCWRWLRTSRQGIRNQSPRRSRG